MRSPCPMAPTVSVRARDATPRAVRLGGRARRNPGRGGGDGEPACKPDSVRRALRPAWVAIHLCGLPGDIGRAGRPTLGLAPGGGCQPPGSPPTLVRSYRTVSPLPVRATDLPAPRHRRSALCCPVPAGRPVLAFASTLALWSPDFPRPGRRSDRAAATWPAHRRPPVYDDRPRVPNGEAIAVVGRLSRQWRAGADRDCLRTAGVTAIASGPSDRWSGSAGRPDTTRAGPRRPPPASATSAASAGRRGPGGGRRPTRAGRAS
jgi:hypothetical protein